MEEEPKAAEELSKEESKVEDESKAAPEEESKASEESGEEEDAAEESEEEAKEEAAEGSEEEEEAAKVSEEEAREGFPAGQPAYIARAAAPTTCVPIGPCCGQLNNYPTAPQSLPDVTGKRTRQDEERPQEMLEPDGPWFNGMGNDVLTRYGAKLAIKRRFEELCEARMDHVEAAVQALANKGVSESRQR